METVVLRSAIWFNAFMDPHIRALQQAIERIKNQVHGLTATQRILEQALYDYRRQRDDTQPRPKKRQRETQQLAILQTVLQAGKDGATLTDIHDVLSATGVTISKKAISSYLARLKKSRRVDHVNGRWIAINPFGS